MHRIPAQGRPWEALKQELEAAKAGDYAWRRGRLAVYVYYLDEALSRVQQEAYAAYWTENNLGQRAFPSLKRLEEEVVGMGLSLMAAPEGAGGTFTSGGSESIFLSLLAARERAREERGIAGGNVVMPNSAHLTFDRACWYLGLEPRRVPVGAAFRADPAAMEAAMDGRTIALVGSAPCYPFGVFDPIADLGRIARARGLWLHVDACVGGFLSPFAAKLGHEIPEWDFRVPGVTAISADIHKHGMAPKGASLLLVREEGLRRFHRFESRAWQRGPYAAYTTQGTRPGGAVAAAWAVMHYLGEAGYLDCARRIMEAKAALVAGIEAIPGLEVLRPSELSLFVYRATDPALDIARVAAALDRRGWLPGRQQEPDGMHLHLNPVHRGVEADYLADLRAAVEEARRGAVERMAAGRTY
ncbi:pyridoxal phosphate-dependent decarboxylase family protein [Crenalkalicoccus roseus]|uniref:pyridoxal phosphate-dependent decarboxylase family protein n=1 Tax=Crenalkalicoccus roseus TaxID=1485588 RepID=UPI001080A314|nr:aminotransferase class V-fold PLP-dependent enzyme [Crenalkalicoccus roseus]